MTRTVRMLFLAVVLFIFQATAEGNECRLRKEGSGFASMEISAARARTGLDTREKGCGTVVNQFNGRRKATYRIMENGIFQLDEAEDRWTRLSDYGKDLMPESPAIAFGSAHILIFSGNEVLAYHTITDTWTCIASSPEVFPQGGIAVKHAGEIVVAPKDGGADPWVVTITEEAVFGWVNYTIVAIYLLLMLAVGFFFSRHNSGSEQFFKGGGKIPWWAAGISIFATTLSAITFLSIPAKTYSADWGMFMFNMAIILVVPLVINFYLPLFRRLKVASVYEYLESRFSSGMRLLSSAFFCLFMFTRIAIVLFLPSLALNAVTGINIYLCIVLMGIVTIIYSTMGGIEAVVWGDVIQGILLLGGALISLFWIIRGIDGGVTGLVQTAVQDNKFNLFDFKFDWTQPVFWVALIGGLSNQFLSYTSDQSIVQKYLTVKDTKGTRRGLWLNGILSVPTTLIFFSIGTALYVFFKQRPELLDVGMSNTDSIFPHYIMSQLPVGISGLLIAAVFAAAMSTLSSNINSSTTVMSVDFYCKFKKDISDKQKVRFARISGVIVGVLGILTALALATFDIASLWDEFNFFLGILTSGLGGLFMMGIFTKRIGTKAAFTGFAGSFIMLILIHNFTPASSTLYGFFGLVSSFAIGYAASFIFGRGR